MKKLLIFIALTTSLTAHANQDDTLTLLADLMKNDELFKLTAISEKLGEPKFADNAIFEESGTTVHNGGALLYRYDSPKDGAFFRRGITNTWHTVNVKLNDKPTISVSFRLEFDQAHCPSIDKIERAFDKTAISYPPMLPTPPLPNPNGTPTIMPIQEQKTLYSIHLDKENTVHFNPYVCEIDLRTYKPLSSNPIKN